MSVDGARVVLQKLGKLAPPKRPRYTQPNLSRLSAPITTPNAICMTFGENTGMEYEKLL